MLCLCARACSLRVNGRIFCCFGSNLQVRGILESDEGTIDLPMCADSEHPPWQMVDHQQGKPATTRYVVRERYPNKDETRVELHPLTGRTHQLRVHMHAIGHPIVGDTLYSKSAFATKTANDVDWEDESSRLKLHAEFTSFVNPVSNKRVTVECPAPF